MKVCIVGAGNVGTQLACHAAEKGHEVVVYGSKPDKVSKSLTIVDENDTVLHTGEISCATSNPEVAFAGTELIFITLPALMMKGIAATIEPYACSGMRICVVPGTGGGECAFKSCIDKGATFFGVQRVPSVARLVTYGQKVRAVGYRSEMFVASIPNADAANCAALVESILDMKTSVLPNYLNITLTPSNPILHTTRLKNLYLDWKEGMVYPSVPLFYEGWNDETSTLLLACDEEVQQICKKLSCFDLSYVKSLKIHYESPDAQALTRKIQSITGFKGLTSPAVEVPGGFIPDLSSRYFTADFSYGLAILLQIAAFTGVEVPNMEATMKWYKDLVGETNDYSFAEFGINNYSDFVEFYSK